MKILLFRRIASVPAGILGFAVVLSALLVIALAVLAHEGDNPGHLGANLADGGVILAWDSPAVDSGSVTGYEIIRRRPYEGELALPADAAGAAASTISHTSSNSYTDTTATAGATYVYRVRALRGNRKSNWSNYVRVNRTHAVSFDSVPEFTPEPPPAPQNLRATVENGTVMLSWHSPENGSVTGYRIFRSVNDGNLLEVYVENTHGTGTTYSDVAVEANVSYFYRVGALGAFGLGELSNYASVRLPPAAPDPIVPEPDPALYVPVKAPVHMASIDWLWDPNEHVSEFTMDFTIHTDVGSFSPETNGLYLMLGHAKLRDIQFYFGLQTDVHNPHASGEPYEKGIIFSRWGTRDLANAKVADGGWSQSSGHEGDFIGVRLPYDWGAGDYRARLALEDGDAGEEGWYGVWITDLSIGITTWAGSLKFPLPDESPRRVNMYSTMEIYGQRLRPVDIPEWHVSLKRPSINGVRAPSGRILYDGNGREVPNSDASYDEGEDAIHFRAGNFTSRLTPPGRLSFG